MNHSKWMKEALNVAKLALSLNEVPVGCIILNEHEQIIGHGHNQTNLKKNPTRHAEFEAIDEAFDWCKENKMNWEDVFSKSTLYVTCEPCVMCASALIKVNIKNWIYGCSNDRFGGCGSVLNIPDMESIPSSINIVKGIHEDLAINLLQNFYTIENPFAPEPKSKSTRKAPMAPATETA